MIDDSGKAAFYQLARLREIHDLEDLGRYDAQYRSVLKSLSDRSESLMGVAVNLSTPPGDELRSRVKEARGGGATMSLKGFYDRLSSVSLFMGVRMKDITHYFAELLERGWIGGVRERRGREIIELRQPQVEYIQESLRERMGGSGVTVEGAMGEMGLDYTAYHIIKRLERDGELILEESASGERYWCWR